MPDELGAGPVFLCSACGTEAPDTLKACPRCHRLRHADELKGLAEEAERATRAGDLTAALVAWRSALDLLPPGSRQHEAIQGRISGLARQVDEAPLPIGQPATQDAQGPHWAGGAGAAGLGTVALALWKFKFLAIMVLSKAKFLMVGLTKASTFYSMLVSMSVYAIAWGWKFAAGIVISIYIHEMGHVAALMRYGIRPSAPMFIPGVGAVVRSQQAFGDSRQEGRVALAGPLWGLGAAVGCYAIFVATGLAYWGALARVGAMLNLFNLMPFWQLDGGRAFRTLNRPERWFATCVIAAMWSVTSDGFLFLIMLVAAYQAAFGKPAREPDRPATLLYAALIGSLSALLMLHVVAPR